VENLLLDANMDLRIIGESVVNYHFFAYSIFGIAIVYINNKTTVAYHIADIKEFNMLFPAFFLDIHFHCFVYRFWSQQCVPHGAGRWYDGAVCHSVWLTSICCP